jgi:5-methylthioadenosine/S-adenosylhomocysteine deaminase
MSNASPDAQRTTVDALVFPRWLLPMSGAATVLDGHGIAISGAKIVAVGPSTILRTRYTAKREYQLDSHALLPGLINSHGHAPMALMRGYADDLPLQPWLEQKIWPAEARWLSEDYVADGARLAIAEMLLGGTTCFTDMYFFPDQVATAALEAGMRAQLCCPVFDFATAWATDADDYIAKATRLHDLHRDSTLIRIAFGPHAPYTVSDAPLRKLAMLAHELDIGIHMHVHENAQELREAQRTSGLRPLSRLKQLDLLGPRLQAVHMTQLLDDEITLLAQHGVHVVHCPSSNLKLASGFCRVTELHAAGVNVALGTDGAASNNRLDMFGELRLAALLAKGMSNDAQAVSAHTALRMATVNGACALGLEEQLGTIETGKLADVVAVDLDHANTKPVYDPVSTLVYSAQASQVSHVWVNGQLLVDGGKLTRLDVAQVLQRAEHWSTQIAEPPSP